MASYDKQPVVVVPGGAGGAWRSWDEVLRQLDSARANRLVIDCYPGVDCAEICHALTKANPTLTIIDPAEALKPSAILDQMLARFLTEDRVFGYMAPFTLDEFFDEAELAKLKATVTGATAPIAVVGVGAALISEGDCLVVADMPRWEIQLRYRSGLANWTADNPKEDVLCKYKRAFFIEWRAADRHKLPLLEKADFFLDTTMRSNPKLIAGDAMRAALEAVTRRPFRVVPFFDPGVWGGQWMRKHFDLSSDKPNYAWGFDCVPEENSLLLAFGDVTVEIPSINVVLRHPKPLLGEKVHARFGAEFPIRFDFLDTVDGGNLSLQVHPITDYARQNFGIAYTQDESYYILAAEPDAAVYLGLRNGITPDRFFGAIEDAQKGGAHLDAERFVNRLPASRHDHFSIPAGTVHCAGTNCVVLEISATPYIFTFKLWDWGRLGLDGRPRPVHLDHGRQVLQGDRDTDWVKSTTLNLVQPIAEGEGWREERTGLHELEFIETRRHWFTKPVTHETRGSVHVVNLVEGETAVIESPDGAFAPVPISFAESFIIPASLGTYRISPGAGGVQHATIRASVRV
jgi:mannose-6-phosphate isomerase class I